MPSLRPAFASFTTFAAVVIFAAVGYQPPVEGLIAAEPKLKSSLCAWTSSELPAALEACEWCVPGCDARAASANASKPAAAVAPTETRAILRRRRACSMREEASTPVRRPAAPKGLL